jgi:hypothetical protein
MTSTETPGAANEPLTPRLREFQAEVEQLKVTGGRANPERAGMIVGALAIGVGVILSLLGWILTQRTTSNLDFASYNAMGIFGLTLAIAGTGLFVVMSLRRYFRYWLVRFIYEMRDQADRLVNKR